MPKMTLALLLLMGAAAQAQVDVRVEIDPPVTPYHRQAVLTLTAEGPADADIDLPDMRSLMGDLEVYGVPEFAKVPLGNDRIRVTERYILDPVMVRDYVLGPIEVTWNETNTVVVPSPLFRVRDLTEVELEQAQIFDPDLEGGRGAPGANWLRRWEFWALASVIVIALVIWLASRRRLHEVYELDEEQIRPAWEVARERLAALAQRNLPEGGKYEPYYVDLSSILRYYIEDRFDLHAPERTTQEFLAEAADEHIFDDTQVKFLARFLRHCDRVKFARLVPDQETMRESFGEVSGFVDDTMPSEPEPEAEETAAA